MEKHIPGYVAQVCGEGGVGEGTAQQHRAGDPGNLQSAVCTPSANRVAPLTAAVPSNDKYDHAQAEKLGTMGVDKVVCVTVDEPSKVAELAAKDTLRSAKASAS